MSAQITHLPASTTQEELLHYMAEDGAVIIDDVLRSEQLHALEHALAPILKKEVYGRDAFTGFHTQRIGALIARSRACGELALEPRIPDDVAHDLAERGHNVTRTPSPHGGCQAIYIDDENGVLVGGSDPRKDGMAIGY